MTLHLQEHSADLMKEQEHNLRGIVERRRVASKRALLALAASCAVAGVFLGEKATSAAQDEFEIDTTRASLEKWVETRRIISKERQDWALGKEVLGDRIEIVADEIKSLRERIEESEGDIAEADRKRAELLLQNEQLKDASASLEEAILGLEQRTLALIPRLPQPLQERIKPLSQQLPKGEALSLSIRFQNVIGLLNAVNKFNTEITHTNEVHDLGWGTSAEVTAMYLGLGQSYYVNADGTSAAVGRPNSEGWEWSAATEQAADVQRAIMILKDEAQPAFVRLPVRVAK
jgi:hypothetical protein